MSKPEEQNKTENTEEKQPMVEIPVEMYVNLKATATQIKTGRPIRLPESLTPDEYNWFKGYMDKQYKKLTAKVPFPPKKLKVVKDFGNTEFDKDGLLKEDIN